MLNAVAGKRHPHRYIIRHDLQLQRSASLSPVQSVKDNYNLPLPF